MKKTITFCWGRIPRFYRLPKMGYNDQTYHNGVKFRNTVWISFLDVAFGVNWIDVDAAHCWQGKLKNKLV